jgi:predicted nucleotidyltransferase
MKEEGASNVANSYVESVISLAGRTKEIVSVIVFGSFAKGGFSASSDVDLILVVSNDCSPRIMHELNDVLEGQAIRFGLSRTRKSLGGKILSALLTQTGIFVSHFVTRESDLLRLDFSRIFGTNRILASMIAPENIVLAGLLSHAKTIFGENLLPIRKPIQVGSGQLARSMIMNLLLATGALLVSPFTDRATELSLEATKWSLFAGYYFVYRDSPGINTVAEKFVSAGIIPSFVRRMLLLRSNRANDGLFILMAPLAVIAVHVSIGKLLT